LEATDGCFFLLELALGLNAAILVDLRGFCSGISFARERVILLLMVGLSSRLRYFEE
jgi:hypothetical protein